MAGANRQRGAPLFAPEVRGARRVATVLVGRAAAAEPALIESTPGAVWSPGGRPRAVFAFRVVGGAIARIEILTDPGVLAALDIEILAQTPQRLCPKR